MPAPRIRRPRRGEHHGIVGPPTGFAQSLFEHPCQGGVRAEGAGHDDPRVSAVRDRTGHVGVHVVPGRQERGHEHRRSADVAQHLGGRRPQHVDERGAHRPHPLGRRFGERRNGFDAGAAAGAVRDEHQLRGAHRLASSSRSYSAGSSANR